MKIIRYETVIILWSLAILAGLAYAVYIDYISKFYASARGVIIYTFIFILVAILREIGKIKKVLFALEEAIKYEQTRKDFEILPFFIEEKKKEYIKGASKAYDDVIRILEEIGSDESLKIAEIIKERRNALRIVEEG